MDRTRPRRLAPPSPRRASPRRAPASAKRARLLPAGGEDHARAGREQGGHLSHSTSGRSRQTLAQVPHPRRGGEGVVWSSGAVKAAVIATSLLFASGLLIASCASAKHPPRAPTGSVVRGGGRGRCAPPPTDHATDELQPLLRNDSGSRRSSTGGRRRRCSPHSRPARRTAASSCIARRYDSTRSISIPRARSNSSPLTPRSRCSMT